MERSGEFIDESAFLLDLFIYCMAVDDMYQRCNWSLAAFRTTGHDILWMRLALGYCFVMIMVLPVDSSLKMVLGELQLSTLVAEVMLLAEEAGSQQEHQPQCFLIGWIVLQAL